MDFFTRQDQVKAKGRLFFCAFVPALMLAVLLLYFVVTGCWILINYAGQEGHISYLGGTAIFYPDNGRGLMSYELQKPFEARWLNRTAVVLMAAHDGLPDLIYNSPTRVLAWRPILIVSSLIGLLIF